jgi:hypothetical protein
MHDTDATMITSRRPEMMAEVALKRVLLPPAHRGGGPGLSL